MNHKESVFGLAAPLFALPLATPTLAAAPATRFASRLPPARPLPPPLRNYPLLLNHNTTPHFASQVPIS